MTELDRLSAIAELIRPCPVPDVGNGYDLCGHGKVWPCPETKAAWIARRLDPATESARLVREKWNEFVAEQWGEHYDPREWEEWADERDVVS